nr:miraculin-like isoform X1 [Ipomoea trifida]
MKTPFLFLSAILFSVLLCVASKSPDPVLDINGKILRTNTKYYIVPLHDLIGGGLDLALSRPRGDTCPQSVVQDKVNKSGLAVQFYPVNSKKGVIRESTDLNIAFPDAHAKCLNSNVWTIEGDVSCSCDFVCQDVSVEDLEGKKLLVLSNPPLEIAFREA